MLVQYLSPMLIVLLLSVPALRWPRLALPLLGAGVLFIVWFFRHAHAASQPRVSMCARPRKAEPRLPQPPASP